MVCLFEFLLWCVLYLWVGFVTKYIVNYGLPSASVTSKRSRGVNSIQNKQVIQFTKLQKPRGARTYVCIICNASGVDVVQQWDTGTYPCVKIAAYNRGELWLYLVHDVGQMGSGLGVRDVPAGQGG